MQGIRIVVEKNPDFLSTEEWIKEKHITIDEVAEHAGLTVADKYAVRYMEAGICATENILFTRSDRAYTISRTDCHQEREYAKVLEQVLSSIKFQNSEKINRKFNSRNGLVSFSY